MSLFLLLLSHQAISQSGEPTVEVMPRFMYGFFGQKLFTRSQIYQESSETVSMPMYGVQVAWSPKGQYGNTYSLVALYGTGNGEIASILGGEPYSGKLSTERTDIELLAQSPIGAGNTRFNLGARYIRFELTSDQRNSAPLPFGSPTPTVPVGAIKITDKWTYDLYLGEVGLSFDAPVDVGSPADDPKLRKHFLFGTFNVLGGVMNRVFSNDFIFSGSPLVAAFSTKDIYNLDPIPVFGVDSFVGYRFRFTDSGSASVRYRAAILSGAFVGNNTNTSFFHGPELAVSWQF